MRRRIKDARIKFLSLVPRGMNALPVVYKSADGSVTFNTLSKWDEEKGELLAVVYSPERFDSEGDIASPEAIRKMAHSFAKEGQNIDIRHNEQKLSRDQVYVAENFIVQKGDARFEGMKDIHGKPVDVTGAWAVLIKIEDENLRKNYREGGWNGVSMFGPAEFEMLKEAPPPPPPWKQEQNMTEAEIKKMFEENNKALVPTLVAEVVKALKPAEEKPTEKPATPAVNPLDPEAVKKHLDALEAKKLLESVDWNDPAEVKKHYEALAAKEKPETDEEKKLRKEMAEIQTKLDTLQKASTVPPSSGESKPQVSKAEALASAGHSDADAYNKRRGYVRA